MDDQQINMSIEKLLNKLVKPKYPNIEYFAIKNIKYKDEFRGDAFDYPIIIAYVNSLDDDDRNSIDWEIKDVLKYLGIKYYVFGIEMVN